MTNLSLHDKVFLQITDRKGCETMEQKQYLNISRLRDDDLPDFHVGDRIIVEEKIDGANFSFRYDAEKDQICSFSRRVELHAKNTLFGAW